ncbi:hypothetical protein ACNI3K_07815 [Demequina sp. SO4-13]|uniref:hypothetical protein n=1 Tax=Demequina sp. SO4-13 TaxID=3401027 RepID=UPI003AF7D41E
MTLEKVTEGRHPVRVTAPTVTTARPGTAVPPRTAAPARDARTAADRSAEVERRTRVGIVVGSVLFRTLAVAGLLLIAYLAFAQAWIPAATDALLGWYSSTIAPQLEIDLMVRQLPVGDGSLFGNPTTPSFVVTD